MSGASSVAGMRTELRQAPASGWFRCAACSQSPARAGLDYAQLLSKMRCPWLGLVLGWRYTVTTTSSAAAQASQKWRLTVRWSCCSCCSVKAPPITAANAAELGRKGGLASAATRKRKAEELKAAKAALAEVPVSTSEQLRTQAVLRQIDRCDELMLKAKAADFVKLATAKDKLWNMLFPRAGSVQHKGKLNRRTMPAAIPVQPVDMAAVTQETGGN